MNHPASSSVPCPECGKPLPIATAGQPRPVCPACLLAQALVSGTAFDPAASPSSATANPPPPPPTPEQIADKFPQFEILACLGRGGMGVVYKARQKSLNRLVALKILAPERERDARFAERFAREAELLAKLSHPHIVTIHDFGETAGLFYIVMEFVDGVNLRDLIREGKLEARQALAIVPPICEALQYAHEKGVVHRDIKPENLLLDREGRVKIADFGIAALVGTGDGAGERAGTPPYMAPEQGDARREVDHRADIYALGVVLYEMLTGERPAKDLVAPSRKVQIDIRLDEIVLRALEKSPSLRYQTAGEFRTQVEATLTAPPVNPPDRADRAPSSAAASRTPPPPAPALIKSTAARVAWAAPATAAGTRAESAPLITPSVGSVVLHTYGLIVRSGAETREVPLAALTACGEALPPAWASPARHRYVGVEFTDPATVQRQRLVFQPGTPLFILPGTTAPRAAEWLAALRAAHQAATGRELPVWPAPWVFPLRGAPRLLPFILFATLSCLLVLLLFTHGTLGLAEIALLVFLNPLTFALACVGGLLAFRARCLRHRSPEAPLPPDGRELPNVRSKVAAPAFAMAVVGGMDLLGAVIGLLAFGLMAFGLIPPIPGGVGTEGLSDVPLLVSLPTRVMTAAIFGWMLLWMGTCVFVLVSALRMQRLRSRGGAIASAVILMVQGSVGFAFANGPTPWVTVGWSVIELGAGLWALVVLLRTDVRGAFEKAPQVPGA